MRNTQHKEDPKMPNNRKYYTNGSVHFISTRTETGLPLIPTFLVNHIIWGILASARDRYDVRICHFLFMANHFHLLAVVGNPQHLSDFVGYVKGEIAHAVNRLLGRKKRTIWEEGYDSPRLLTAADVLRYINYIYANPAKANLEKDIDRYPGVSSWTMFLEDDFCRKHQRVERFAIPKLASPALSIGEQKRIVSRLQSLGGDTHEFQLEPWAWLNSFPETQNAEIGELKSRIIGDLRAVELEEELKRREHNKQVIGATALRRQSMLLEHTPKKHAPRMVCISSDHDLRKAFLSLYRELCSIARRTYEAWKRGELSKRMPPGLFAPHVPILCSEFGI